MGMPIHPIFDHRSPEWPENERRYIRGYLRQQAIMSAVVYGSALLFIIFMLVVFALKDAGVVG